VIGWALIAALLLAVIVAPFIAFESALTNFTDQSLRDARSSYAIFALVITSLMLDVLLPIPSSAVAIASGSLQGPVLGLVSNWLGLSLGSLFGYTLGRHGGRAIGQRLVGSQGLDRAHQFAENYGAVAVALCRPLPILAEASVIVMGMSKMHFGRFVWVSSASNVAIAAVYSLTGAWVMQEGSPWLVVVVSILAPLPIWGVYRRIVASK
jgi:uncharacterized membrane protein YdjX (TVP38/TMEM64 family)